jgi:two-component system, chemotaxis family, protein-glutamate methylesterase/glutaminase
MLQIRLEVVPKIKALCWKSEGYRGHQTPESPDRLSWDQRVDIVAIGTSTGGPNALAEVIPHIPAGFPVPILIVQHMPPTFTRFLAARLTASSSIVVEEGVSGALAEPGHAWIAPGDFHMNLRREDRSIRLGVFQSEPENSCRPSVDVLFRSVAEVFRQNVLAVVMTGMGQDGLRGCEHIKGAHGQVIVQDEASSAVWGMPGFVARAGLADRILPVIEIADEIVRRVNRGRRMLLHASPVSRVLRLTKRSAQGGERGD